MSWEAQQYILMLWLAGNCLAPKNLLTNLVLRALWEVTKPCWLIRNSTPSTFPYPTACTRSGPSKLYKRVNMFYARNPSPWVLMKPAVCSMQRVQMASCCLSHIPTGSNRKQVTWSNTSLRQMAPVLAIFEVCTPVLDLPWATLKRISA